MDRVRILLVSGGSLVGQNVLDVLAGRRTQVYLAATNSVPTDLSLFEFDAVYLTPPTKAPDFENRFVEILAREQPDVVIPCRDDDVFFLADFRERRPELAGGFLCGNRYTAEATCDKWQSWEFSTASGLPFVPSIATPNVAAAEAFSREHGFPLLAKPRRGYASLGVYLVSSPQQLCRAAAREGLIIQKFLGDAAMLSAYLDEVAAVGVPLFHSFEGIRHSIQVFIAPDGTIAGNFCTLNVSRNGTSTRLDRHAGDGAAELGEQCAHAFAEAGWQGPLNIQCQKAADGRLYIYEFNGRFSGATAARYHMGYDEIAVALRTFAGRELTDGEAGQAAAVVRRAIDRSLPAEQAARLAREGSWRREGA